MSPGRWRYTTRYLSEVFGAEDEAAASIRERCDRAGLPPIAVTGDIGRFLTLLVRISGTRTAVEVGTLGGYSALHIIRGLALGGRLITIESDRRAAELARENLDAAGVGDAVRIEEGPALAVLPRLAEELGPRSVGFAFLDADKKEYVQYWTHLRPLLADGGLLAADNILGTSRWWIDEEEHESRRAVDEFNRLLAADPEFETAGLLVREGLLLTRRREEARTSPSPGGRRDKGV
jgi:predicted O-methyltransferase YrrM